LLRYPDPERDLISAAIEPDALGIQCVKLQPAPAGSACFEIFLTIFSPAKPLALVGNLQANPIPSDAERQMN